ncbi:MAG: phytanoyl-CoA dioxygenase family protein, partial [Acidobacteriota bacterium]
KLPGDGLEFPWHQDSTHRRFGSPLWSDINGRGSFVQTLTALDDMTRENGTLELIAGSHRLGHLGWLETQPLPDHLAASAVPAIMAAGSVLLFGPYTIHSSRPNRSAGSRRAFINGYAHPGANRRVYPGRGAGRLLHSSGGPPPS